MIQDVLDERANYFAQAYRMFNMALIGRFSQAMNENVTQSQRARSTLDKGVREAIQTHLSFASETIADSTQRVSMDAVQSVLSATKQDAAPIFLNSKIANWNAAGVADMEQLTYAALTRDGNQVSREFRRFNLKIQILMNQGVGRVSAIMQSKRSLNAELNFTYVDTLNRKWPMEHYLRTAFRGHLLNNYNDIVLMTIASFGADLTNQGLAQIQYQDPAHDGNGEIISIGAPKAGMRSYDQVREEVFHPNSSAVLAPVTNS